MTESDFTVHLLVLTSSVWEAEDSVMWGVWLEQHICQMRMGAL